MRIILLPGMDGTGLLFQPLLENLPKSRNTTVITYPGDKRLSYIELLQYVREQLPENEDYLLVAESFSGPVAYCLAQHPPSNLKSVIFVASFLHVPWRALSFIKWLPFALLFHLPIPSFVIKRVLLGKEVKEGVINLFKESLKKVSKSVLAFRLREIAALENQQ